MGDFADMMLDGTLCEGCGEFMGDAVDFPRLCSACAKNRRAAGHNVERNGLGGWVDFGKQKAPTPQRKKARCPTCGKRVWESGVKDHMRDAHGVR